MAEGQRQYTEDDKAAALAMLAAHDGNYTSTALALGIPVSTLHQWAAYGIGINEAVSAKTDGKKLELADAFERIAERAIAAMTDTKMADAPLNQLGTVAGIAVDKMRLLREQASPDARELGRLDEIRANIAKLQGAKAEE